MVVKGKVSRKVPFSVEIQGKAKAPAYPGGLATIKEK